jgi:hypothetical protein
MSQAISAGRGSIAILGTPGFLENAGTLETDALRKSVGENTGNLLFQSAVGKILAGAKHYSGHSDLVEALGSTTTHVVFPSANHLRLGANWSGLNKIFEETTAKIVVLGLGAQAPDIGGGRDSLERLAADPGLRAFADVLGRKAAFVGLRGHFSQQVSRRLGLTKIDILGCPSLFINPDAELGRKVSKRLIGLRDKALKSDIKLMIAAAAPFEIRETPKAGVERVLLDWLSIAQGIYVQQSGGNLVMDFARGRYQTVPLGPLLSMREILAPAMSLDDFIALMRTRQRIYWSAEAWIAAAKTHDLAVGTRFHGVMAGIQAGVPGIFLAHDSRTNEMIESMKLPMLPLSVFEKSPRLADAIDAVSFDGEAFDANRARIASLMTRRLESCGLEVAAYVKSLAAGA